MTISSEVRKAGPFAGNDVATSFPFTFKVFSDTDVLVVQADALGAESTLELGTDYTVTLNSDQNVSPGGTVELSDALPTGEKLVLSSQVEPLQPVDLTNSGGFYPSVINQALDRSTILIQQLSEKVDRTIKVSITSGLTPDEFVEELQQGASDAAASAAAAAASAAAAAASEEASRTDSTNITHGATTVSAAITALETAVATVASADVGRVAFFPRSTAPTGYLKANGAAVSRTTYASLFAVCGTTFGAGDGSTTFNLPDLRGEFIRGLDDGRGIDTGRVLGSAQSDEFKAHSHTLQVYDSTLSGGNNSKAPSGGQNPIGTHVTSSAGGAETRPRNVALLACIKY